MGLLFAVGAAYTLLPLWVPLVLAAWFAILFRGLHARVSRRMHGRRKGAGAVTVLLVLAVLAPLTLVILSLASDAVTLVRTVLESRGRDAGAFQTLIEAGQRGLHGEPPRRLLQLIRQHGGEAMRVASMLFGAGARLVIALVVFVSGFYSFLVNGQRIYEWVLDHAPLRRRHTERLAGAFAETGNGLLVGMGLTALFQGAVATIGYLVVGIPHAFVLGLLTAISALIPSVGTGLVWVPVAIALLIAGRVAGAIGILIVGAVVSVADNFIRPMLSKRAQLQLPLLVLFIAMLGGIFAYGGWGLVLGPLMVRMTVEAVGLLREEREAAAKWQGPEIDAGGAPSQEGAAATAPSAGAAARRPWKPVPAP